MMTTMAVTGAATLCPKILRSSIHHQIHIQPKIDDADDDHHILSDGRLTGIEGESSAHENDGRSERDAIDQQETDQEPEADRLIERRTEPNRFFVSVTSRRATTSPLIIQPKAQSHVQPFVGHQRSEADPRGRVVNGVPLNVIERNQ